MKHKFNPMPGDKVRVCYDGKIGRAVTGTVIESFRDTIKVEFCEWSKGVKLVKCWFSRINKYSFGGYLEIEDSLMLIMFGTPGDWYSIFEMEK